MLPVSAVPSADLKRDLASEGFKFGRIGFKMRSEGKNGAGRNFDADCRGRSRGMFFLCVSTTGIDGVVFKSECKNITAKNCFLCYNKVCIL